MCCSSGPSAAQNNAAQAQANLAQAQVQMYNTESNYLPGSLQTQQELQKLQLQEQQMIAPHLPQMLADSEAASKQQAQLATQQYNIANTMFQNYQTQFADQQNILKTLTGVLQPIVSAGPNQYGFSKGEDTALRTMSSDATAQAYQSAMKSAGQQIAAESGGNQLLPSGTNAAITSGISSQAAAQQAKQQLGISQAGYQQGYNQWLGATQALGQTGNLSNPASNGNAALSGMGSSSGITTAGLQNLGLGIGTVSEPGQVLNQASSGINQQSGALVNMGNAASQGFQSAYQMANINNQQANAASLWNTVGGILGGIGGPLTAGLL